MYGREEIQGHALSTCGGSGDLVGPADFVATDPKGRLLYATSDSSLIAYSIDDTTGKLTLQREVPTISQGQNAIAWLAVDAQARFLVVGNNGSMSIHRLDAVSGLPLSTDGGIGGGTVYGTGGNNFGGGEAILATGLAVYHPTGSSLGGWEVVPATLDLTSRGGGNSTAAVYPLEAIGHPSGLTVFAAGHGLGGYLAGDGGVLAMVGYAVSPAFCHAVTISPSQKQLYAACGTRIHSADINGTTGALSIHDASTPAYDGSVGGYGISRSFAWVPR